MSGGDGEGFLSRWSRRKAGSTSAPAPTPAAPAAATPASAAGMQAPNPPVESRPADVPAAEAAPAAPPPTLEDVAALTRDSDYVRFMQPGVDGVVRNAAMKKLFSDPHFNVMDGLDTYIDDYGKPDPLPLSMLRRMEQAATLGLFRDDRSSAPAAPVPESKASPDGPPPGVVAPSQETEPTAADAASRAEDEPDLRLQPNDGDRRPGAGESPRS